MSHLDLERIFTYHPPKPTQRGRYEVLRAAAKDFAEIIAELTPASAEQTLAIRRVQEAVMWANASIAINETSDEPKE
jgi:hypothetical protein